MNLVSSALSGAGWLAGFKIISQTCSWIATIIVTRMLLSEDYGLMEMATIFTGYVALFVEFGIGSALINKDKLGQEELSTAFWFSILWGFALSISCFVLAPITADYYQEPRIYYLTQGASLLFILASFSIVPRSILQRKMKFKEIAIIEFVTVLFSSLLMIFLAYLGAGPWTLLGGFIAREAFRVIFFVVKSKFIPSLVFRKNLLGPLIRFGTPVMLSTSLFYIYSKADRFFGGSTFGAEDLGYYALALQLAAIPVEKIVSLLQGVLFPTLSKLKHDTERFKRVYLGFVSLLALIIFPLFIGGLLLSHQLVQVVLGDAWINAVKPLQILFVAQLFVAVSAPNSLIHAARGKPKWNLIFNLIITPCLVVSFYYSSQLTPLYKLAIPWITVFPAFQAVYIGITNRELGIKLSVYLKSLLHPVLACGVMSLFVLSLSVFFQTESAFMLVLSILLGALSYVAYFMLIGKSFISGLLDLRNL